MHESGSKEAAPLEKVWSLGELFSSTPDKVTPKSDDRTHGDEVEIETPPEWHYPHLPDQLSISQQNESDPALCENDLTLVNTKDWIPVVKSGI